jgi:hypothetical protein
MVPSNSPRQLMVALSFLPMLGGVLSYLTLIIWAATWIVTARNQRRLVQVK